MRTKTKGIVNKFGYVSFYMPSHNRAGRNGYVKEHIMVAEKVFGKPLPKEAVIHHHTETQLVICENQGYHMFLHQRARALAECGHPDWIRCSFCGVWGPKTDFYLYPNRNEGYHSKCHSEDLRRRRANGYGAIHNARRRLQTQKRTEEKAKTELAKEIRAYECWPVWEPEWKQIIYARSYGKAKYDRMTDLLDGWDSTKYTDIRCRVLRSFAYNESAESFANNARYRGIEFARLGMKVEVGGKPGVIVGHNSSANLDILFENGHVLNCHPHWKIKYFDKDGKLIREFDS